MSKRVEWRHLLTIQETVRAGAGAGVGWDELVVYSAVISRHAGCVGDVVGDVM
jgi:hypothetical protein